MRWVVLLSMCMLLPACVEEPRGRLPPPAVYEPDEPDEPSEPAIEPLIAPTANPLGPNKNCAFHRDNASFIGEPSTQASCLLRAVDGNGHVSASLADLPQRLAAVVGQPVSITADTLRVYLVRRAIREDEIGGAIDAPVSSTTRALQPQAARYFVIHDTRFPVYSSGQGFPATINGLFWEYQRLGRWKNVPAQAHTRAHVLINRLGQSITLRSFRERLIATRFERDDLRRDDAGLFLHVVLVQPRLAGRRQTAAVPPVPGFTNAQYERLALVYIAASVRRGEWMIPALHAVLDAGAPQPADDPRNFNLQRFNGFLSRQLRALFATQER